MMSMQFGDADWYVMIAATIAALHAENNYPLTASTAGHMTYLAREEPGADVNTLRAWLTAQPHPAPVPAPVPPPPPVPVPVPTPAPPPGGPMPDRSQEVRMVCELHPEAFPRVFDPAHPELGGVTDEELNAMRFHLLRNEIIPTLNSLDGGRWGFLKKTDQNGKIPVDIACWAPGNEIVDVMTGTGAFWKPQPNPRPGVWIWTAA